MTEPADDERHTTLQSPNIAHAPTQSEDITTKILDFLSSASNEALGACLVGLGAATYFILGRLGLLLIGVLCGVVLHATWEGNAKRDISSTELKRRKEVGLDIARRLLDLQQWRLSGSSVDISGKDEIQVQLSAHRELTFEGFAPETATALNSFVDAVIDGYVKLVCPRLH